MKNKKVNLNDICFFQEGPGVRKHQYCTKGVKLINVSNLVNGEVDLSNSNRYISQEEAYGRYKHFLIDEGDLIIASSGIKVEYLDKKVAFIKRENLPLCMNTSTIRFKVKNKNELDILYLSYFLKSKNFKNQISKLITGSAQLNFGGSHLKKINLFLPELNVQKKVSTLLLLIDNTIKNMQRKISILEQLTKSLFTRMFGDIKSNDKNWKIYKFSEKLKISSGGTPSKANKIYWENGTISWIGSNMCNDEIITKNDGKFITEEGLKNSSAKIYKMNTVIVALVGATIGKTGLLKFETSTNQNIAALEIKNMDYSPEFLFFLLQNLYYKFTELGGDTFKMANLSFIKNLPLISPPIELQNKFTERVEKIEKLKFIFDKALISNIFGKLYKKVSA